MIYGVHDLNHMLEKLIEINFLKINQNDIVLTIKNQWVDDLVLTEVMSWSRFFIILDRINFLNYFFISDQFKFQVDLSNQFRFYNYDIYINIYHILSIQHIFFSNVFFLL